MAIKPDKAEATGKVTLTEHGALDIRFAYDPVLIAKVKTLSGRQYSSGPPKRWNAPVTDENIAKLRAWNFTIAKEVIKPYLEKQARKAAPLPAIDFGCLDDVLDDNQKDGVRRIEAFGGRALNADDPGVGKTAQTLAWLYLHPESRPAVIITKKSGKHVWQRAAKRGLLTDHRGYVPLLPDDRVQVIRGEQNVEIDADVIIANYDIIARVEPCPDCNGEGDRGGIECKTCRGSGEHVYLREDIAAVRPKFVGLDEPQQISNPRAQRTVAAKELARHAEHIIGSTASPIKRRPKQFFNILNLLKPDVFPSFWHYAQEFCGAVHNGYGWNFDGASNLDKLYALLIEKVMIRRTTEQVFGKLPLDRTVVPLDIKNRGEYEAADADFMAWLRAKGDVERLDRAERAEALVKCSTLLRMAAERKRDAVLDWLHDWLDDNDGKLIVFTMHTALLDEIMAAFPEISVRLDGSTSEKGRRAAEDRFQTDLDCRLFAGNSDAAGDTITLTAAHDVAFAELPRTSEDVKQNEGRAYARRNDPHGLRSWFLVAADTIEERRAEQLNEGARIVGAALDGLAVNNEDDMIKLLTREDKIKWK